MEHASLYKVRGTYANHKTNSKSAFHFYHISCRWIMKLSKITRFVVIQFWQKSLASKVRIIFTFLPFRNPFNFLWQQQPRHWRQQQHLQQQQKKTLPETSATTVAAAQTTAARTYISSCCNNKYSNTNFYNCSNSNYNYRAAATRVI